MAIIFADVVPEINKLYEYMAQFKKDEIRYGRTTYVFVPVNGTVRPELMVVPKRYGQSSKLYDEYEDIVNRCRQSAELSRHEKSIVRAFYKYIYSRFDTTVDTLNTNMQTITKLNGEVTKLENQLNMLKAIKNPEKFAPRYVKLCGIIVSLDRQPNDPYENIAQGIKNARDDLDYHLKQIASAKDKRKKARLAGVIEDLITRLSKNLPVYSARIKQMMNEEIAWEVKYDNFQSLDLDAFENCDMDKILSVHTGSATKFHDMLMKNGQQVNTDYWAHTFITNDLNMVLFANGIDTNLLHKEYTAEDYAKIAKISQIFGVIKAVEQDAAKLTVKKDCNYHHNMRVHFDLVRNKLKEIGYDPDVSLL